MAATNKTTTIKLLVLCSNSEGAPEIHTCSVQMTPEQIAEGLHYDVAKENADLNGYEEPMIAFDEQDPAARMILDDSLRAWLTAAAPSVEVTPVTVTVANGWQITVEGEKLDVRKPDGRISSWLSRPATNGSGMYELCMDLFNESRRLDALSVDDEFTLKIEQHFRNRIEDGDLDLGTIPRLITNYGLYGAAKFVSEMDERMQGSLLGTPADTDD